METAEFKTAALAMADRIDAMSGEQFFKWRTQASDGTIVIPEVDYDPIALEWIELLVPLGLMAQSEAYEAIARRGWDTAGMIATANWDDTVHIASALVRAQRTTGKPILEEARQQGMLSAILRRLAALADTQPEIAAPK